MLDSSELIELLFTKWLDSKEIPEPMFNYADVITKVGRIYASNIPELNNLSVLRHNNNAFTVLKIEKVYGEIQKIIVTDPVLYFVNMFEKVVEPPTRHVIEFQKRKSSESAFFNMMNTYYDEMIRRMQAFEPYLKEAFTIQINALPVEAAWKAVRIKNFNKLKIVAESL